MNTTTRSRWGIAIAGSILATLLLAAVVFASVRLTHFGALPGPGAGEITVSWQTETELDVIAFRLVRSTQPLVQTAAPIHTTPAVGSGTAGAWYQFNDSGLTPGQRYYYWLYEITSSGDVYLLTQSVTAVAPAQSVPSHSVWLPLAPHRG